APGIFLHASTGTGAALAVSATAPIAAAPPARNIRRCRSPLPATCSVSIRDVSFMIVLPAHIALGRIVVRSVPQGTGGFHFSRAKSVWPHCGLGWVPTALAAQDFVAAPPFVCGIM